MSALIDKFTRRFTVQVSTDQEWALPDVEDIEAALRQSDWPYNPMVFIVEESK